MRPLAEYIYLTKCFLQRRRRHPGLENELDPAEERLQQRRFELAQLLTLHDIEFAGKLLASLRRGEVEYFIGMDWGAGDDELEAVAIERQGEVIEVGQFEGGQRYVVGVQDLSGAVLILRSQDGQEVRAPIAGGRVEVAVQDEPPNDSAWAEAARRFQGDREFLTISASYPARISQLAQRVSSARRPPRPKKGPPPPREWWRRR